MKACIKAMPIKADATGEETSTYDDDCVEPIDFSSIKQSMFIAVDKNEWSDRPQIGRVEGILKDAVNITWLYGTYGSLKIALTMDQGISGRIGFLSVIL